MRVKGEPRPGGGPRLLQSTEMRQRRRQMEMSGWIVPIGLDGSSLKADRLFIAAK
jgi:hypothetical protein